MKRFLPNFHFVVVEQQPVEGKHRILRILSPLSRSAWEGAIGFVRAITSGGRVPRDLCQH